MITTFVPDNFNVPEKFETNKFRLRMLSVRDVDKDYEAVMSSINHLCGVFGPLFEWPTKDLTHEQDLVDLGWHQKEFQIRNSFTYTVVSLDEKEVLGCVYIFKPNKKSYDAEIYMWVKESAFNKGLDFVLFTSVKKWVDEKWPFKKVAYPGREIDWKIWAEEK
jgi:hypothetical protein